VVEAGFQAGRTVPRVTLDPVRKVEDFKVYAPILMAGIDNNRMPDTILDRSIVIRMKRYIGPRLHYRPRQHDEQGYALGKDIAEWAKAVQDRAKTIQPVMPDELNDREQDKWEPLFIVGYLADVADVASIAAVAPNSGWLQKIRRAALELSQEEKDTEAVSNGEQLLKDIRLVFNNDFLVLDKIKTTELLDKLICIEDAPWGDYAFGKPLDGRGLAKILRPYKIGPKDIRFGQDTLKGYYKNQFEDAFKRYLGVEYESSRLGQPPETRATSAITATGATDITSSL
jgi:hypothetical protein